MEIVIAIVVIAILAGVVFISKKRAASRGAPLRGGGSYDGTRQQ